MKKHVTLHKRVGETPLQVLEAYRTTAGLAPEVPLAYAGRLDPMADGKLLVLLGNECKKQTRYHGLDKAYRFQILFGFTSDTADILGIATPHEKKEVAKHTLTEALKDFLGVQEFPYPRFSSKTVQGKPLHMWTLENRLDEITIPTNSTNVYTLKLESLKEIPTQHLREEMFKKINSFPEVSDPKKALGEDFRREHVRARWNELLPEHATAHYTVATIYCEASSGTYMRTLAEEIGKRVGAGGLAYAITRTKIGKLWNTPFGTFWYKSF